MSSSTAPRLFIAHARGDRNLVDRLRQHLEALPSWGVMVAVDDGEIEPGRQGATRVRAELAMADLVLLLISPAFLRSRYGHSTELQGALDRHDQGQARVIPIALRPCPWGGAPFDRLPGLPRGLKAVSTWPSVDLAILEIAQAVDELVRALRRRPEPEADGLGASSDGSHGARHGRRSTPNPYPGLAAFGRADADRFFGREALTDTLHAHYAALHEAPRGAVRLLAILGPSGAGKSSLARAGLAARLERHPLATRPSAQVVVVRPRANPLFQLGLELAGRLFHSDAPVHMANHLAEAMAGSRDGRFTGLADIVDALPASAPRHLHLVVDQFEEIYTLCDDRTERDAFVATLLDAVARPGGRVSVVLTLESDGLGALRQHPALDAVVTAQHQLVPALRADQLRRAIAVPAAEAGHPIDDPTVARLVAETEGLVGALPRLQFVLARLFEAMAAGMPAALALDRLGGVAPALASEAGRLYERLGDAQKRIARRAFVAMVRLGQGRHDVGRRASLVELRADDPPEQLHPVLDSFAQPGARLISLATGDGPPTAEIAHQAVLDHWPRLGHWLAEQRADTRLRGRLADAARRWDQLGRPADALWHSPELDLLRDLRRRGADDLTRLERAFGDAAERAASDRSLARRRRRRRARVLAASLALLAATTTGLAWYAYVRGIEAETARTEADRQHRVATARLQMAEAARRLAERRRDEVAAANSQLLADLSWVEAEAGETTLATLLALEAFDQADGRHPAEAEAALLHALLAQRERHVLDGHLDAVNTIAFSPDGARLVTAGQDGAAKLWDAGNGAELASLEGHRRPVQAARFSPDGTEIVTASADGTARIWKASSGRSRATLDGDAGAVLDAAFDPSGRRLLTLSADGTARLWDTVSGKPTASLGGERAPIHHAVFGPGGDVLLTVGRDGSARLWRVGNATAIARLRGHDGPVLDVAFSPRGRRIATASKDGTVRVFRAAGARLTTLRGHRAGVTAVAFDASGQLVATASEDRTARIWPASGGDAQVTLSGHGGAVRDVAFSPDGEQVVTAADDGTARIWQRRDGALVAVLRGHRGAVRQVAFAPDGSQIATVADDGTARLWRPSATEAVATLDGHGGEVHGARFAPGGGQVATASADGTVRLWSTRTKAQLALLKDPKAGEGAEIRHVAYLDGGEYLVSASSRGVTRVWDVLAAQAAGTQIGGEGWPGWAVFSADGARVVSVADSGGARLWDAGSGLLVAPLADHGGPVRHVAFAPDDRLVATSAADGSVGLWDGRDGDHLATLHGHEGPVVFATFTPDGDRLATASLDGTARLWDTRSGRSLAVLDGHLGALGQVDFSPAGQLLVSAAADGTARLWDGVTGEHLLTLRGHEDGVRQAVFSPDGRLVATASADGTARIWHVESGRTVATLRGHRGGVVSARFAPDGGALVTASRDGTARLWRLPFAAHDDWVEVARRRLPHRHGATGRRQLVGPAPARPVTQATITPTRHASGGGSGSGSGGGDGRRQ